MTAPKHTPSLGIYTNAQILQELKHRVAIGKIDLHLKNDEDHDLTKLVVRVEDVHSDARVGWLVPVPSNVKITVLPTLVPFPLPLDAQKGVPV